MTKRKWELPQIIVLNPNHIESANMQTMAVYEAIYFMISNTCVNIPGTETCLTGTGILYYTSLSSGISASATSICLNAAGTTFGLSTAPPNCMYGTFTGFGPIGTMNIGTIPTCSPGIQCS